VAKKQLGKYDIIERLGRGGMAEVFKAYQASLDRFVAIKLLHPFLADDPEFKDRFEREARNVARLRHPNIVQVYDFEYDDDSESYYMVMELIEGQTLKDYLAGHNDERLALPDALRILRGATEALAYAHARSMIHRDMKPANLMIDNDGRVVLTDFGIAKIVTGIQFTASGGMVGTPAYMAPEQGLGDAGDERSDLYSLGVILFQLITGKLPYESDAPLAVILKHLNEPIPSVRALVPDVPENIEAIIYKAMAKDPEERYQTAEDMLRDLDAAAGIQTADTGLRKTDTGEVAAVRSSGQKNHDTLTFSEDADAAHLATSTAIQPPSRRTSFAGMAAIAVVGIALLLGVTALASGRLNGSGGTSTAISTTGIPIVAANSTNTPTASATLTLTSTSTSTLTSTPTPSATPTSTATPTQTNTPTPSRTPIPSDTLTPTINGTATLDAATLVAANATGTYVYNAFLTLQAQSTPTVDLTGTASHCVKSYRQILEKQPKQDPIHVDVDFSRTITLLNTSDCDWQPGMYLFFKDGEQFGAPVKLVMTNNTPVAPSQKATFDFIGHTPKKGSLQPYSGTWEVRLKDGVLVEPPLTISFFVYE
jgi:serine/threonine-protein kinase